MKNDDIDVLLTTRDVCEILKIGRTKLYDMISKKEIVSFRIGKNIRIPKCELIEYIKTSCN